MQYKEYQSSDYFSKHIECYWEMTLHPGELDSPFELLSPDCTFDILITSEPVFLKSHLDKNWKKVLPGASFLGQKTNGISFSVQQSSTVFGIRFKPFAFAKLIKAPLYLFNDQVLALEKLFDLGHSDKKQIELIAKSEEIAEKIEWTEILFLNLLKKSFSIDQNLRAQLNYILDRKGVVKINDIFTEFGVSKVTLRNHFINKMGLAPKKVSRIWRINYFLQLKEANPDYSFTELCLDAGFYDQAHFIKEFKFFFGSPPRDFFQYESQLLKISQVAISKRFSNLYDPR